MRLLTLLLFTGAGALYSLAALQSYVEETRARGTTAPGDPILEAPSLHPEANLRRLRDAFASDDYTDELRPFLERALTQAPTFYQPSFLLAAFHANRLEEPEVVRNSFEAALSRFPSNGRLHLTYAEWLLTPRATAPYRAFRVNGTDEEARARALHHVASAASLEPDLSPRALEVMLRFRVPMATWIDILPNDPTTKRWVLHTADRTPRERHARRELLAAFLSGSRDPATLRVIVQFGRKWDEPDIALSASELWHETVLETGPGSDVTQATLSLAHVCLDNGQADRAYDVVRSTLKTMNEKGFVADSAELLVGMGDLYLARRRVATAEGLYTEAVTRFPYHVRARVGLARAYRQNGDNDGAVRELRRVLELEPNHAEARALLDAILEPG